jgi:CO dehydrogenase nickel-insertion accessory protein CooC1
MRDKRLAGLRIGIFGKGGAGKSTVTVFLARALRELGYPVVVLDADSTNVGLAAALGADREPDPLLDFFGGMVFSGGAVTCPVDDPTRLAGADLRLDALPARFVAHTPYGIHLLVAGKLGALGPGAGCDGPVAKITRDLRVRRDKGDPVMLVDHKAGFEDAARGAVTAVDWAIAAVDPTPAAIQMAWHLAAMIAAIRRGVPPATRHLDSPDLVDLAVQVYREARTRHVVTLLNRVSTPVVEGQLRTALEGSGAPPVAVFREERRVGAQWLRGERLRSPRLAEAARILVHEIEARPDETAASEVPHEEHLTATAGNEGWRDRAPASRNTI